MQRAFVSAMANGSREKADDADLDERLTALRAVRHTLHDAGHHPHLECPERLAGVLIGFLRRTPCEA